MLQVTGGGSGVTLEVPVAIVAEFREGLVTRLADYGDHQRALEAAGLLE
jgi:ketosteroid isomerase-like protein